MRHGPCLQRPHSMLKECLNRTVFNIEQYTKLFQGLSWGVVNLTRSCFMQCCFFFQVPNSCRRVISLPLFKRSFVMHFSMFKCQGCISVFVASFFPLPSPPPPSSTLTRTSNLGSSCSLSLILLKGPSYLFLCKYGKVPSLMQMLNINTSQCPGAMFP